MAARVLAAAVLLAVGLGFGLVVGPLAARADPPAAAENRAATGGAPTLDDILKRQRGLPVADHFRRQATGDPAAAAALSAQLGTLGGASDADLWRALRYGSADITVSSGGLEATVLMQDGGMRWLARRDGPLARYGGGLLIVMLVVVAVFFLSRGRIRVDGAKTGRTITRFKAVERFGHWLLAGAFVVLALSGLITLFGREAIMPLIGKAAYADVAMAAKWLHNNVAWAFILGLVMVTVMWLLHNLPDRTDLAWLAKGGGLFSKKHHPPARKFNAGQKLIFWSVVLFGASISVSGLSLLFPFELPMFAATFSALNATGLPELLGLGVLPDQLSPHEEMQFAQLWHAIAGFILMAIVIAHIYIGSLGMEGAFAAMASGEVDEAWARQHHQLWLADMAAPAEPTPEDPANTPAAAE